MPLEGLQLGHYRLLRLIGSGGMGEVYLAEDTRLHRQVAIKVIRAEASSYPNAVANKEAARLFQREAKAIAMLDHLHILPLFDYGEEYVNGVEFIYLVMPFRQEGSLTNWLRQRSNSNLLSIGDVEHFVRHAGSALQYAHDRQIIHQDVKPSNFLIRNNADNPSRPDLLLTDFGVAKLSTATSSMSHSVRGTPNYMAPEQWTGDPVPATDQYALAIMAYELLAGRPPFLGAPMRMMYLHTQTQAQPPSTLNPQIPADMDTVLLCALAKQPADRFASISAFANAFSQALQSIDSPTILRTVNMRVSNELHATLAISEVEALNGAQRTLTLPEGRQITVSVPANAYDGQIIRLAGLGGSPGNNGSTDTLFLTLIVKHAADAATTSNPGNIESTIPASNPNILLDATRITPLLEPNVTQTQAQAPINRQRNSKGKIILLIGLVLLIIAASAGFLFYTNQSNQAAINTANTATAQSLHTGATAQANTATAQAYVVATNQANAFATGQANGAATVQANVNATATVSANATEQANLRATAQANVNATATVNAQNPNPYPPYSGSLGLNDPLSNNNQGNNWQENQDSLSACQFSGGAYHSIETKNAFYSDCFSDPYFSNFAYQVQMQIIQGDCGGIIFRANPTHTQFYYFRICQDGSYTLFLYVDNKNIDAKTLTSGTSSTFRTGLYQTNVIAAVASGSQINLYANQQFITGVSDSSYSNGHIGVAAQDEGNSTEVAFSNMKVWVF